VAVPHSSQEPPVGGYPLRPGASPGAIRAALLTEEDQAEFDADYEQALTEARQSLDLAELFRTLEQWRRIAMLHSNPEQFRKVARRTAELLTGQPVPHDEPLSVTRARAGL
jgi:Family of unknown function (DUF6247)